MSEDELFTLRNRIGMVFQESALFDSQSVRDNVAFRLIEEHVPDPEIDARVHEVLSFVELEHTMQKFPSQALRRHAPPRRHRPRHHHPPRSHPL